MEPVFPLAIQGIKTIEAFADHAGPKISVALVPP